MIELKQVSKTFGKGDKSVHALHPTDLTIQQDEVVGLLGFSGAGKSTLLRLINRLESPSGGRILVEGQDVTRLSESNLRQVRQRIGMIFQQFNLLSSSTALENVLFGIQVSGRAAADAREKAMKLCTWWVWPIKPKPILHSCQGGKSSVLPLPVHWPWSLVLCCVMKPLQHLIPIQRCLFCDFSNPCNENEA